MLENDKIIVYCTSNRLSLGHQHRSRWQNRLKMRSSFMQTVPKRKIFHSFIFMRSRVYIFAENNRRLGSRTLGRWCYLTERINFTIFTGFRFAIWQMWTRARARPWRKKLEKSCAKEIFLWCCVWNQMNTHNFGRVSERAQARFVHA